MDNLSTVDKLAGPNVSFMKSFYCSGHIEVVFGVTRQEFAKYGEQMSTFPECNNRDSGLSHNHINEIVINDLKDYVNNK